MSVTKNDVIKTLEDVKHPAINLSLIELGMLRDITLEGDTVKAEFVFPFPNIPIKEALFASVRTPLEAMNLEVIFSEAVMTPDEVERFLALETANWKS